MRARPALNGCATYEEEDDGDEHDYLWEGELGGVGSVDTKGAEVFSEVVSSVDCGHVAEVGLVIAYEQSVDQRYHYFPEQGQSYESFRTSLHAL